MLLRRLHIPYTYAVTFSLTKTENRGSDVAMRAEMAAAVFAVTAKGLK